MRVLTTAVGVLGVLVVGTSPAFAQHPYGLDPYNPSDAAILRTYGQTLVTPTPLADLAKLDPYKPSEAALLRQLGGAQPWYIWGWVDFPPQVPGLTRPPASSGAEAGGRTARFGAPTPQRLPVLPAERSLPRLPEMPKRTPPVQEVQNADPEMSESARKPVMRIIVHEDKALDDARSSPLRDLVELSIRVRQAKTQQSEVVPVGTLAQRSTPDSSR